MLLGGISVESKSWSISRYGGLAAVPVLTCNNGDCPGIGRSQAMSAVWWRGAWVKVPDFLVIDGGGDRYLDVPYGPCRERAILHILHWFSKTHEDSADKHACFLPPPLDRACAIVCRKGVACSYSTLSLTSDTGFVIPTLHTIFVKASHRRMGCAQQLLLGFYRPPDGRLRLKRCVEGKEAKLERVPPLDLPNCIEPLTTPRPTFAPS